MNITDTLMALATRMVDRALAGDSLGLDAAKGELRRALDAASAGQQLPPPTDDRLRSQEAQPFADRAAPGPGAAPAGAAGAAGAAARVDAPAPQAAQVADLAMLVSRLAHSLRITSPESALPAQATDYLVRHGLTSPLRATAAPVSDKRLDAAQHKTDERFRSGQTE